MGERRLLTSRSCSVPLSSQKPLLWPVSRLGLARWRSFLYLPPASVRWHRTAPKAGTLLLILLTGWHPTAPHRLAPYCSPPAGTLLLPTGWHPAATHRLAPYCSSSSAGIPSARWLRSPTYLSPSCDLLYGRKPRLGYG